MFPPIGIAAFSPPASILQPPVASGSSPDENEGASISSGGLCSSAPAAGGGRWRSGWSALEAVLRFLWAGFSPRGRQSVALVEIESE